MKRIIKKITPKFLISFYHFFLSFLGAFLYGFPSKKLKVIGVTGTNGKSTVVEMIADILGEAGFLACSMSSIQFRIAGKKFSNNLKMTMPGRFKIQKFLRQAVGDGCKYAVLEVTSEGIRQFRHKFIHFETAVFTNLSPEHIESHGGFEKYKSAKAELFLAAKGTHIINLDDDNAKYFLRYNAEKKYLYKLKTQNSKLKTITQNSKFVEAENVVEKSNSVVFRIQNTEFNLGLIGRFNVYNSLAAICVGLSEGVSLEVCAEALKKVKKVPGRMEIVAKNPFTVIVDYAHNPAALERVYKTLRKPNDQIPMPNQIPNPNAQKKKIICVLGSCGGGRDKWKRPVLGKLAGQYCDKIIITNEDPYDDNPLEIIEEVASGLSQVSGSKFQVPCYMKILDRREAIKKALESANPGDIVVITGKGCEPWMCIADGKKIPWDDRKIVREELAKKYSKEYPNNI